MARKIRNNYIDNKKFLVEMKKYKREYNEAKENGTKLPRIPEYIGECFLKLATNLARRPNFYAYPFKDEMISYAVENAVTYCYNFDPERYSNAFGYFNRMMWTAFLRKIKAEKNEYYFKCKMAENFLLLYENEISDCEESELPPFLLYENQYEFIKEFEQKEKEKKELKQKNKGIELFIEKEEETEIDE